MLKEFKGKTALITGAAHGFGAEYAKEAARRGMKVAMLDIDKPALDAFEGEIKALGAQTLAIHGDVTKYEDIKSAIKATLDKFGTVDLMINNAGVYYVGNIWEVPVEDVKWMLETNVFSIFYAMKEIIPVMEKQGTDCHIINVASLAGLVSMPTMSCYHASKHAVVAASEAAAQELKRVGSKIGVSIFCPGYVQTDLHHSWDYKPDHYSKDDPYYQTAEYAKNVGRVEKFITTGVPIDFVAPSAFDAIENDQFYIFPEHVYDPFVTARHDKIMKRENP